MGQIAMTTDKSPTDARHSGISGTASTSKVQQFWAGLPIAGRVAVVVVPVLVLLGIIAAVAGVGSRDEHSYQYGYQHIGPAAAALLRAGLEGKEYACRQSYGMVAGLLDENGQAIGTHYVTKDVIDGCLAALG